MDWKCTVHQLKPCCCGPGGGTTPTIASHLPVFICYNNIMSNEHKMYVSSQNYVVFPESRNAKSAVSQRDVSTPICTFRDVLVSNAYCMYSTILLFMVRTLIRQYGHFGIQCLLYSTVVLFMVSTLIRQYGLCQTALKPQLFFLDFCRCLWYCIAVLYTYSLCAG